MNKTITYSHDLTKKAAFNKISKIIPKLHNQYRKNIQDAEWEWNDNKDIMTFSLRIKGFDVSGDLHLKNNKIVMQAEVPWAATLFWGKIKSMITAKLDELIG